MKYYGYDMEYFLIDKGFIYWIKQKYGDSLLKILSDSVCPKDEKARISFCRRLKPSGLRRKGMIEAGSFTSIRGTNHNVQKEKLFGKRSRWNMGFQKYLGLGFSSQRFAFNTNEWFYKLKILKPMKQKSR